MSPLVEESWEVTSPVTPSSGSIFLHSCLPSSTLIGGEEGERETEGDGDRERDRDRERESETTGIRQVSRGHVMEQVKV